MILSLALSIVAAIAQMSGGWLVLRSDWPKRWEATMLALGAGFLLALVFIELIPRSIELTDHNDFALLAMLLGFSALHFFEHILAGHMHFGEETHHHHALSNSSVYGAIGGLAVHAFFDGMSICAAVQVKPSIGILVFVAVLLHKVPEGLTVASVLRAGDHSAATSRRANLALPLATLAGAVVVLLFLTINSQLIGFLFAFSAGASVYVGASDLIPEINRSHSRTAPLAVFIGMVLFWLGAHLVAQFIGS